MSRIGPAKHDRLVGLLIALAVLLTAAPIHAESEKATAEAQQQAGAEGEAQGTESAGGESTGDLAESGSGSRRIAIEIGPSA